MPDQAHVAPAGLLVRGRAGGRLSRSLLTVAHGRPLPAGAARPAIAQGAAVPELYPLPQAVVATSRAAAPRGTAPAKGVTTQTGTGSRGLRPTETAAPGSTATLTVA